VFGVFGLLTVVALPPIESSSSDQEIEDETKDEPEGVLSFRMLAGVSRLAFH
jgi:hypothetical protein